MRIVEFITRSDTIGGAQVHTRDLSVHLRSRGHDVRVFVGGAGPFTEDLEAHGVPFQSLEQLVRAIQPLKDLAALFELLTHLRAERPDLLATHSGKAGWLGRLAGWMLGIPTVFTAHGWTFASASTATGRFVYRGIERVTAPLAGRVITVSEHDGRLAQAYRIVSPKRLRVVHNGVPDFDANAERYADVTQTPPRLVTVARLQEPKDFRTLLTALAPLLEYDWSLDIIGDGPLEGQVMQEIDALRLTGRVRLLGLRKDVPDLLAQSQIALLISKKEGLPLSILEAMRAALPVVASDVGGVREVVVDEETGLLIPSGDSQALTEQLRRVITSPKLREALGRAGRARFEAHFSVQQMVEKTEQVYSELVQAMRKDDVP